MQEINKDTIVNILGQKNNVKRFIKSHNATTLPSYHEGTANVLLESSSCGRPCITTNIAGCKEIIDDGKTGFLCAVKNVESLVLAIEKFIALSWEDKKQMDVFAREKVKIEFDRNIVVNAHLKEIKKVVTLKNK